MFPMIAGGFQQNKSMAAESIDSADFNLNNFTKFKNATKKTKLRLFVQTNGPLPGVVWQGEKTEKTSTWPKEGKTQVMVGPAFKWNWDWEFGPTAVKGVTRSRPFWIEGMYFPQSDKSVFPWIYGELGMGQFKPVAELGSYLEPMLIFDIGEVWKNLNDKTKFDEATKTRYLRITVLGLLQSLLSLVIPLQNKDVPWNGKWAKVLRRLPTGLLSGALAGTVPDMDFREGVIKGASMGLLGGALSKALAEMYDGTREKSHKGRDLADPLLQTATQGAVQGATNALLLKVLDLVVPQVVPQAARV